MSPEPTTPAERDGRRLPDQVTMGLLPYLSAHALDEDYAEVARRREDSPHPPSRRRIGVAGSLALAVFAVLAVTAAAQNSQDSVTQERERRALVDEVKASKAAVEADRRTIARLQAENRRLEDDLFDNTSVTGGVLSRLQLLALRSGTSAVHGPGVEVVVDDAVDAQSDRDKVLDSDLQKLVNGLWRAGAEAISINGQRLTNLSAIRQAGGGITVNFDPVNRPYRVLAIGDPNTLPSRFAKTTSGQAWLDLPRQVGLQFRMLTKSTLRLPAAEVPTLRHAEPPETAAGKGSP